MLLHSTTCRGCTCRAKTLYGNDYWSLVGWIGWVMGESRSVLLRFEHHWGDLRSFPCTDDLIGVVYLCGTGVKWKLRLMWRLQGSWHGILKNDWTWQSLTCTLTFPPGPTSFNITLEQPIFNMQGEQMLTGPIVNERKILLYGGKGVKVFSVAARLHFALYNPSKTMGISCKKSPSLKRLVTDHGKPDLPKPDVDGCR